MSTRSALSVVEQQYGSLEELAYHILEEKDEALDESLPLAMRAESVGLPMLVFARILADPMFRQMLRADLVNKRYGLTEEEEHIRVMVKVATGEERRVVTNKGNVEHVDQAPTDIIAAGKYLNELRGTPVEGKKESAFKGVVVNFENITVNVGKADAAEPITLEAHAHIPRRAGDLPPAALPSRRPAAVPLPAANGAPHDGDVGAFYGPGAREADAAHALARRDEGAPARPEPEAPPLRRRGLWPGRSGSVDRRARQVANQRPDYDD